MKYVHRLHYQYYSETLKKEKAIQDNRIFNNHRNQIWQKMKNIHYTRSDSDYIDLPIHDISINNIAYCLII